MCGSSTTGRVRPSLFLYPSTWRAESWSHLITAVLLGCDDNGDGDDEEEEEEDDTRDADATVAAATVADVHLLTVSTCAPCDRN